MHQLISFSDRDKSYIIGAYFFENINTTYKVHIFCLIIQIWKTCQLKQRFLKCSQSYKWKSHMNFKPIFYPAKLKFTYLNFEFCSLFHQEYFKNSKDLSVICCQKSRVTKKRWPWNSTGLSEKQPASPIV